MLPLGCFSILVSYLIVDFNCKHQFRRVGWADFPNPST
jgi:hypothetical protein